MALHKCFSNSEDKSKTAVNLISSAKLSVGVEKIVCRERGNRERGNEMTNNLKCIVHVEQTSKAIDDLIHETIPHRLHRYSSGARKTRDS